MKITINVDCTPEEARTFLGLPDVGPMQAEMMQIVQQRMRQALDSTDPEALMKTWLPIGLGAAEQIQKMFWAAAAGAAEGVQKKKPGDKS
jgi:hypothetical protein